MAKKKTSDAPAAPAAPRRRTTRSSRPDAALPPVEGALVQEQTSSPQPPVAEAADATPRTARQADAAPGNGAATEPRYDDIAHEAYMRYLRRGGGHGLDFDDWLEAERTLKMRK